LNLDLNVPVYDILRVSGLDSRSRPSHHLSRVLCGVFQYLPNLRDAPHK
jgi:hypothetical protein